MEREILDVLKAFEDKKITIIEAHTKICDIALSQNERLNHECVFESDKIIILEKK